MCHSSSAKKKKKRKKEIAVGGFFLMHECEKGFLETWHPVSSVLTDGGMAYCIQQRKAVADLLGWPQALLCLLCGLCEVAAVVLASSV